MGLSSSVVGTAKEMGLLSVEMWGWHSASRKSGKDGLSLCNPDLRGKVTYVIFRFADRSPEMEI